MLLICCKAAASYCAKWVDVCFAAGGRFFSPKKKLEFSNFGS
jgi:hypothetical protein